MRLDKLLAHTGHGTRKQVRELIRSGKVKVDGEIVKKHGLHVDPDKNVVTVFGEKIKYVKYVYLMLNKPQDYLSATYDEHCLTVIDLVPLEYQHFSLAPVGRLDIDTEGFILLTNDGKINHCLTSPKNNIWKTYEAHVSGKVRSEHIEQFKQGIRLDDGYKTKPASLEILDTSAGKSEVRLSITEGKFHQVKRMFQSIGMEVTYLKRTKIGKLTLDEKLELGEMRPLNKREMDWLMEIKEGEA